MADKKVVVVAVDGSACSEKAFNWYADNAYTKGDTVVVTHCMEGPLHTGGFVYDTKDTWRKHFEAAKKDSEAVTAKYTKKLKELNIKGDVQVLQGTPGQAISAYAKDVTASHVVIGSRGQNAIRRTLMGSVSDYVMHHAPCAVTVLKK